MKVFEASNPDFEMEVHIGEVMSLSQISFEIVLIGVTDILSR
jgi:hypothetical protein